MLLCFYCRRWRVQAETRKNGFTLGTRVHGAFGAFIPLGIKIGLDAVKRLDAKPRELAVTYYDSNSSPCACFADGIAIATYASVGQRTLTIAPEKAPDGTLGVAIIRPRKGGPGFKYTIPASDLAKLGPMNKNLDPRGRCGCRHEVRTGCSRSRTRHRRLALIASVIYRPCPVVAVWNSWRHTPHHDACLGIKRK